MHPISTLPFPVAQLSDSPILQRIQRALRMHLTRIWPTRRLPLCPPAMAGLIDSASLDIPALQKVCSTPKCLVVFLPATFAEHLKALAGQSPVLVVHPDISQNQQRAYVSWSCPNQGLPLTIWLELTSLLETLVDHEITHGQLALPVIFVASESIAVSRIEADVRDSFDAALADANRPLPVLGEALQKKLNEKAENYSEQPWFFMRYELKQGDQRYAVHFAPTVRLHPSKA